MVRQCYNPNLIPKLIPHTRKSHIRSRLPPTLCTVHCIKVISYSLACTHTVSIQNHAVKDVALFTEPRVIWYDPSSITAPDPQFLVSEEDIEEDVDGPATRLHPSSHPHTHPTTTSHSKGVIFVERRGEYSFMIWKPYSSGTSVSRTNCSLTMPFVTFETYH